MTFVKGQSGNPKGAPIKTDSLTFLMKEYLSATAKGEKKTNRQIFIEKAYNKAVKDGDGPTMKMIWNYIDGMPKTDSKLELSGSVSLLEILNAVESNRSDLQLSDKVHRENVESSTSAK